MKRNRKLSILKLAIVSALGLGSSLFAAGAHAAVATNDLGVSATVVESCTITSTPVAFGNYAPTGANAVAALDATGAVTLTCTNGATAAVSLGQGATPFTGSDDAVPLRQMASGANRLRYYLYSDTLRLTVWGNTVATDVTAIADGASHGLTVYGRITGGQNVNSGSYVDTVVATVTF